MLTAFSERFQNRFRSSVVPESFTDVGHPVHIPGSKNEGSAQLERILAQFVLAMAAGFGALAGEGIVLAQKMKKGRFLQPNCSIGFSLLIDQKWKGDSCFLSESAGIIRVAEPDRRQPGAFVLEFLFVFAQLRDMLTAENSTPVAEEHQHCRPVRPERAELDLLPINIG